MLKKIATLFSRAPDLINNGYAKAATPDELIAAHIIESMAKDFESWEFTGARSIDAEDQTYYYYDNRKRAGLHRKDGLVFTFKITIDQVTRNYEHQYTRTYSEFEVNDVVISALDGNRIIQSFLKLHKRHKEATAAAAKAKKAMELNEKKWNLAENLLGMKRNEQGALVPKETAE